MGQPIEQCRRHLGIAEHVGPFCEAEVRGDDDAGLLVELGEQMEQECATGWAEGQVSELIEDHEIEAYEALGQLPGLVHDLLLLERVHQINGREEPHLLAVMLDSLDAERGGNVGLAGSWAADQDDVVGAIDEGAGMQLTNRRLVDLAGREVMTWAQNWALCVRFSPGLRTGKGVSSQKIRSARWTATRRRS